MKLVRKFCLFSLLFLAARLVCPAATTLTAYNCWGNLGFEDTPPVNISHWSASGTAISFINDSAQAHAGHGALKIDGTSPISVWGGRVGGSIAPQTGQSVGGFFWIKLLAAPTASASVDVRMTGYISSVETVYTHTVSINLSTLALNTWVKVDLASVGNTFLAGSDTNFNIVSAGGVNCLIDDITFGSLTTTVDPEPPTPPVVPSANSAVTPPFDEYVGSVFNGDFEVGNATVGNQYWGQYVPVGGANMMDLVTAPAGTAPGATKSGKNMVSISRGGVAWNIADLSSTSTDRLPRVGDLVGGSYWLYVPANADLSAGVPNVYFIYQGGGDTTVADTSTFPTSSLVKGAWNLVPIYPKAGATIGAAATKAAIMVAAPQLNTTANPLYPSPYYIDGIRVGKIPAGVFFASATRLVNGAGATITAPATSDTELRIETVLQNSAQAAAQSAYVVLKLFQQDVLVSSTVKAVTIAAKGALGISNTAVSMTGSIAGLDQSKLNARLYLYTDSALTASLAPPRTLLQQTRVVPASDPAIRYVGRWATDGAGKRGNWVRPYFKLTFSRSTSVSINLLQPTSLTVVLDGVTTSYNTVSGRVILGSNLSLSGTHTLKVSGLVWQDSVFFDGLQLDDIAQLHDTAIKQDHIEFIGDSITAWDNGYSWTVPEQLGVEGSRIAYPGIALRDGFGYYQTTPPLYGMASAYFLNGMPGYGTSGNWNFATSPYTPNIVVINLGTNDFAAIQFNAPLVAAFQTAYQGLIQNVRTKFPTAEIFVLRPFTISAADVQTAIQNATQAVITAGDTRVHYVNTSTWNVDIIPGDGIHPSYAGHATITSKLVALLTPYLAGGTRAYAPSITSANTATFPRGQASTFTVTASGSPAPTFQATGLPAWAALNASTGVISGTPPQPGRYTFTIQASNGVGAAASQELTITANATFSQWAASHFSAGQLGNPAIVGATATPQNDGVPNLMKYAFDILPSAPMTSADLAILPKGGTRMISNKSYLTLTYLESPLASGVTRELQVSDDLATWRSQVPDVIQYVMIDGDRLVEGGVALDGAAKRFLRLRLTAQ